jgi:hypothetical protein
VDTAGFLRSIPMMYSPPLVSGASQAIRLALDAPVQDSRADLRRAVEVLCADARRLRLRPEELVVLVKMTWRTHPDVCAMPRHQAGSMLDEVVAMCIEEYFRSSVTR